MQVKKTVVIVEDHTILREGLKSMLNANDDFCVIGEAGDGQNAIRCIMQKKPDLVLLDINMPKMGGISVIKSISGSLPETKIVVLTMHREEEFALEAFKSGASGYCLKTFNPDELLFAIRTVLSGKIFVSPEISDKVLVGYLESKKRIKSTSSWQTLTQREKEVLKLVGEGYRSKEIADFLCISTKTVVRHRANTMRKLDLHSTSALTAYAIDKGLVVK
jgi:DNA-binding NarL/FixJ family response regulator